MEIRQLEYFYYVCRTGSFTLASKQLYITQQGLSKAVAQLEEELGAELFERKPNAIHLTEAGHLFLEHSKKILTSIETAKRQLQGFSEGARPQIYIGFMKGIFDFFPQAFFHILVKELQNNCFFDIKELTAEDCNERIEDGRISAAIVMDPARNRRLAVTPLVESHLYVYMPKSMEVQCEGKVPVNMLLEQKLVLQNDFRYYYEELTRACMEKGFVPDILMKTANRTAFEEACESLGAVGVSYYTEEQVRRHRFSERIHRLEMENPDKCISMITNRNRLYAPTEIMVQERIRALWCGI